MGERKNFSSDAPWESFAGYSRAVRIGKTIEVAGTTAVDSNGQIEWQNNYGFTLTYDGDIKIDNL